MKSLFAALQYKPLLLSAFALSWFEVEFIPHPMRLFFLVGAMAVDLASGLVKSWKKHEATTSAGFQRSVVKISRYCSIIIATWFLANVLATYGPVKVDYSFLVSSVIAFLTFIEIYSIFENVYEIDPTGPVSKFLVGPALKFLRGRLKNSNPFNQLNEDDGNAKPKDTNGDPTEDVNDHP